MCYRNIEAAQTEIVEGANWMQRGAEVRIPSPTIYLMNPLFGNANWIYFLNPAICRIQASLYTDPSSSRVTISPVSVFTTSRSEIILRRSIPPRCESLPDLSLELRALEGRAAARFIKAASKRWA